MLSVKIKDATKDAHQALEKEVILRLKSIRSNGDYADLLKYFYAYFSVVEKVVSPFITPDLLPDHALRRNSNYLKDDIMDLGSEVTELSEAKAPMISSLAGALGAMYVLEGSIMGGGIIVQMLKKYGVDLGISFFSGYGAETGKMWTSFLSVLNGQCTTDQQEQAAISAANETFENFLKTFESKVQA